MQKFNINKLAILFLVICALASCGKRRETPTDYILEDERSAFKPKLGTTITPHPTNPEWVVIADEYGQTIMHKDGSIVDTDVNLDAAIIPEIEVVSETTATEPEIVEAPKNEAVSETTTDEKEEEKPVTREAIQLDNGTIITDILVIESPDETYASNIAPEHIHDGRRPNPHDHTEVTHGDAEDTYAEVPLLISRPEDDNPEAVHIQEEEAMAVNPWEEFSAQYPWGQKEQKDECYEYPTLKDVLTFGVSIESLGGKFQNPTIYSQDLIGFQQFLNEVGVKYFSAYEMTKPGSPKKAKACEFKILLPPRGCWLRSATIALIADKVRGNQGRAVKMTSHWRPSCYNEKVSGSKSSDHIDVRAADLSFGQRKYRKKAQDFICKHFWEDDLINIIGLKSSPTSNQINMQIGLGDTFMHIGVGSPKGRRYWIYESYRTHNKKSHTGCWTDKL